MQALGYTGPGHKSPEERPKSETRVPSDAIVRLYPILDGAEQPITHRFRLQEFLQACDTFGNAADTKASKVVIEA